MQQAQQQRCVCGFAVSTEREGERERERERGGPNEKERGARTRKRRSLCPAQRHCDSIASLLWPVQLWLLLGVRESEPRRRGVLT